MRNMLGKILSIGTAVAAIGLVLLLNLTTPVQAGPVGILVFFICAYIVGLGLVTLTLHGGSRLLSRLLAPLAVKRPFPVMPVRRAYYYASFIAFAPVMLVGMQSVGGISVYDVLLIAAFVVIGCIYISRRIS